MFNVYKTAYIVRGLVIVFFFKLNLLFLKRLEVPISGDEKTLFNSVKTVFNQIYAKKVFKRV